MSGRRRPRGAGFCRCGATFSRRYDYSLKPGWSLERYGIEQQAEIVRHAFLLRNGWKLAGVSDAAAYDVLVRFPGAGVPPDRREKQVTVDV